MRVFYASEDALKRIYNDSQEAAKSGDAILIDNSYAGKAYLVKTSIEKNVLNKQTYAITTPDGLVESKMLRGFVSTRTFVQGNNLQDTIQADHILKDIKIYPMIKKAGMLQVFPVVTSLSNIAEIKKVLDIIQPDLDSIISYSEECDNGLGDTIVCPGVADMLRQSEMFVEDMDISASTSYSSFYLKRSENIDLPCTVKVKVCDDTISLMHIKQYTYLWVQNIVEVVYILKVLSDLGVYAASISVDPRIKYLLRNNLKSDVIIAPQLYQDYNRYNRTILRSFQYCNDHPEVPAVSLSSDVPVNKDTFISKKDIISLESDIL